MLAGALAALPRAPLPEARSLALDDYPRAKATGPDGTGAAARGACGAPADDEALVFLSADRHDLLDCPSKKKYSVHMTEIRFEWDGPKSRTNKRKHGVSFEEAQTVFLDEHAVRFADPDQAATEDRFLMLGMSFQLGTPVVCHCFRAGDAVIRIVSARKADRAEEAECWKRR